MIAKRLGSWIAALLLAGGAGGAGCKETPKPGSGSQPEKAASSVAAQVPAAPLAYTSELTAAERSELYHLPEGGELLPLDLLRAIESVRTFKPFMTDLERFRLIPDPDDPDGLPVGMSAALRNGKRTEPRLVFFNCAACHTAEITYKNQRLRVDGAPAHFDMAGFVVELIQSMDATLLSPDKLAALARNLGSKPAALAQAPERLATAIDATQLLTAKLTYLKRLRGLRTPTFSGYGRLDAFVAARNLLFGEKYAMDVDSPVSLPPVFGLSRLGWFHFDNNTNSFVQRNIGENLGVGAVADAKSGDSTVELRNLMRLEALVRKLPVPRWPEAMLGAIDAARKDRGAPLYQKHCAACHDTDASGRFPDRVIALDKIGTDPNRSKNFAQPLGDQPFSSALGGVLAAVEKRSIEREHLTPEEAAQLEPATVIFRTTAGYASRPIDGVWATAPYLHNGSVPTLYDLLLPESQRPKTFLTGSREFDPKKVGYVSDGAAGAGFLFDTSLSGNHNTGHTYGTTLSEAERLDLLEYLKSR